MQDENGQPGAPARRTGAQPLPPLFLATSISASLLIAVGIIGLAAPQALPVELGMPLAGGCLVAGAALKTWAVRKLIAAFRNARSG